MLVDKQNADTVMETARDLLDRVLSNIRQIGLRISPVKTEAILFGFCGRQKPVLRLDDLDITFKTSMKWE